MGGCVDKGRSTIGCSKLGYIECINRQDCVLSFDDKGEDGNGWGLCSDNTNPVSCDMLNRTECEEKRVNDCMFIDNIEKDEGGGCQDLNCSKLGEDDCVFVNNCQWYTYKFGGGACLNYACTALTHDECYLRSDCTLLKVGVDDDDDDDMYMCIDTGGGVTELPCSGWNRKECAVSSRICEWDDDFNECCFVLTCDMLSKANCSSFPFLPCRYNERFSESSGKCVNFIINPIQCDVLSKEMCEENNDVCVFVEDACSHIPPSADVLPSLIWDLGIEDEVSIFVYLFIYYMFFFSKGT
jgi:hypothetical protein